MDGRLLELVATIIGGNPRHALHLLERADGLAGLARLDALLVADLLSEVKHPHPVRAARALAAGIELGRRAAAMDAKMPERLASTADAAAWATPRLATLAHEELWLLGLDSRGGLRAARCVAKGGLHGVGARVPDVLRTAIGVGAAGFVLVHNHPAGDATPSPEDVRFTRAVSDAARVVDVPLLDHVVVARSGFASVPMGDG